MVTVPPSVRGLVAMLGSPVPVSTQTWLLFAVQTVSPVTEFDAHELMTSVPVGICVLVMLLPPRSPRRSRSEWRMQTGVGRVGWIARSAGVVINVVAGVIVIAAPLPLAAAVVPPAP